MDINQRLEELSHEMKVLKNEIRQILLDIREHVLTYYQNAPAARSEELVEELASPPEESEEKKGKEKDKEKEEERAMPAGGITVNVGSQFRDLPDVRIETEEPRRGREEASSSASFRDEPVGGGLFDTRDEPFGGGFSTDDFRLDEKGGTGAMNDDMLGMMQLLNGMSNQNQGGYGGGYRVRQENNEAPNGNMDLTTIAMLARWVSNGVKKVGRKRLETIVEMYQMTGNLTPKAREVIVRLVRLSDAEEPTGQVPMTAMIPILMQLNTILKGRAQQNIDPALLSMLL